METGEEVIRLEKLDPGLESRMLEGVRVLGDRICRLEESRVRIGKQWSELVERIEAVELGMRMLEAEVRELMEWKGRA